ncbi:hypothetical protein M8C21_025827 [Ambrosia artemisiifolia]|uniref:Protein HEAT INTOLERANT 4 n=1 Tax=Ambrosia artemisiifolia TaxID=4212 RepID=A0AAD5CKJ3_AMBAR|nr:hypothetical protein M8C21_025827 [Ambrosia artemisiifolia]
MKKGTKRKATRKDDGATTTTTTVEPPPQQQEEENKELEKPVRKTKRAKASKPETEPEFFDDQRELWDQLDLLAEYNWNFKNLEIVSPFPPSDKIGINSVQRESEEIVDMKKMKMDWVPYIPLAKRGASVERLKSQIFILSCVQRRAGLRHLTMDRVKKFEYCLPYFYHPFKEDETEQSTIVDIMYPIEPKPVVCEFDWELDELEDFTNDLIAAEELSEDQKDAFKEFIKEKVREGKRANREAREKRKKAREEMSQEKVAAFENMRFYKFYPVATPDTPDVSTVKDTSPCNFWCDGGTGGSGESSGGGRVAEETRKKAILMS